MLGRFLPSHDTIKHSRLLRWLGPRIHDPLLWHVNRHAVARGVAVGAFFGLMIPVAQIPAAAIAALILRGNLWIAAISTLISNPFTYGPLYYFAYRLGGYLIGAPVPAAVEAQIAPAPMAVIDSLTQAWSWLSGIGQPLLLGMAVMATTGAVLGYLGTLGIWRLRVLLKRRNALRSRLAQSARRGLGST
ncbi:MAG TPA: DUF2062 domain-containing protein [Thauera sp.]|nr:DUF2062 domain-containing protein [Thauera sp.]HRA81075.1 DUF2062 domain-containing protein [Thauera sp.]